MESLSSSGPCSVFLTQLCGGIWATTSVIVSPQSRDVQQRRMEKFGHAFMKGYQIPLQWEKSFNGKNKLSSFLLADGIIKPSLKKKEFQPDAT